MHAIVGRDLATGRLQRVAWEGATITAVEPLPDAPGADLPVLAPAFWDLQVNGLEGISFADPSLTVDQVRRVASRLSDDGIARFCPTLITASPEALRHGVRTIASACDGDTDLDRRTLGIHLEGPWISGRDGYRGAHPADQVRDPDWAEFARLQEACGGRIALVTLAPERPGALEFIGRLARAEIIVALGHTAADGPTLRAAVEAGARLSTHLGNGIASPLPRHPNPIWHQAAEDRLFASFIADRRHLDDDTLRILARAKGPERTILVSDLSPLAGCPAGRHGPWEVTGDGTVVVAGTDYLAGASAPLWRDIENLAAVLGWSPASAVGAATANPATLLRLTPPALAPGAPADLVAFAQRPGEPERPLRFLGAVLGGRASRAPGGSDDRQSCETSELIPSPLD
jgi:N-acetylglucosamine-6-phosphate deacetylase